MKHIIITIDEIKNGRAANRILFGKGMVNTRPKYLYGKSTCTLILL